MRQPSPDPCQHLRLRRLRAGPIRDQLHAWLAQEYFIRLDELQPGGVIWRRPLAWQPLVADTIGQMGKSKRPPSEIPSAKTKGASPRPFDEWRADPSNRDEDAAYAFGHALIEHCRDEALKAIPSNATEEVRTSALKAVDTALHNVCDLLEGFWRLDLDPAHRIELALQVRVLNDSDQVVETREISPCKLDLPIGYWKWARDREFR